MVDDRMSMIKIVTVGSLAAYSFAWLFQISEPIGRVTARKKKWFSFGTYFLPRFLWKFVSSMNKCVP